MDKYFLGNEKACSCGIVHFCGSTVFSGSGAVNKLAELLATSSGERAFIVADKNTYSVAGERVEEIVRGAGLAYDKFIYQISPHPDESALGAAFMHCPAGVGVVIAIGSGVINDICKLIAKGIGAEYIIVATAPSMDGYASSSSSMTADGLKVSVPSKMADVIIADTDILATAPDKMLISGVGDILAKYIGLAEWQIGRIIKGEYFCDKIYDFMKKTVDGVVSSVRVNGIDSPITVAAVVDGLIAAGFAMSYANSTRPASGAEHYVSHVYDMRAVAFGTPTETHGIQATLGTLLCLRIYDKLKQMGVDKDKAIKAVESFSADAWFERLRALVGDRAAASMIAAEARDGKYSPEGHKVRLERIIERWDEIAAVIRDLPSYDEMAELCRSIGLPTSFKEAGLDSSILPDVIRATKDVRDKYVLTRLLFDLGIEDEIIDSYIEI